MNINTAQYDETATDCIVNCVTPRWDFNACKEYYDGIRKVGYKDDSKALFKTTFGKQMTCKNYTCRNWIWTFSDDNATVYCLICDTGVSWEYNHKTTKNHDALKYLCCKVIDELVKKARKIVKKS